METRGWRSVAVLAVLLAGVGGLTWWWAETKVKRLAKARVGSDQRAVEEAKQELARRGPAAVPALTDALTDSDPEVRRGAGCALGDLGPGAAGAIPALAKALADPEDKVRSAVARALGSIGPGAEEAVPALAAALSDPDPVVRQVAAGALRQIGPGAKGAVTALVEALADSESGVRFEAKNALRKVDPNWYGSEAAGRAVPALVRALTGKDHEAGSEAAGVLRGVGSGGIQALVAALADRTVEVRARAGAALREIGPSGAVAVPDLLKHLGSEIAHLRGLAAEVLGGIGPGARDAVPALVTCLADPNKYVLSRVLKALRKIDPEWPRSGAADGVVPALAAALAAAQADRNEEAHDAWAVRELAAEALGRVGPRAKDAVPVLVKCLDDPSSSGRREMLQALLAIDPAAKTTLTSLVKCLADSDDGARSVAWGAVERLDPQWRIDPQWASSDATRDAIPTLVAALDSRNGEVRRTAALALGKIGPGAGGAVAALVPRLADDDDAVLSAARQAVDRIDPQWASSGAAGEAVPALVRLLASRDQRCRVEAARVLGEIGPKAKDAVPALEKLLDDSEGDVRKRAGEALERIRKQ